MVDAAALENSGEFQEFAAEFLKNIANFSKDKLEERKPYKWDGVAINRDDLSNWDEPIKSFKPPKSRGVISPYVLFGKVSIANRAGGKKPVTNLHCFKVVEPKAAEPKIAYYVQKGFKVLAYGFPKKEELKPLNEKRLNTISGWELALRDQNMDPFANLRRICEGFMNQAKGLDAASKQREENDKLKAKVEEYEKQLGKNVRKRSSDDNDASSETGGASGEAGKEESRKRSTPTAKTAQPRGKKPEGD